MYTAQDEQLDEDKHSWQLLVLVSRALLHNILIIIFVIYC